MTPSWYDVLGVDPDATAEEVRAAWKDAIADLEPTDRRFRLRNRAAEVLLDPERRAAHDAELVSADDDDDDRDDLDADDETGAVGQADDAAAPTVVPAAAPSLAKTVAPSSADPAPASPDPVPASPDPDAGADRGPALPLLAALGVLALVVVVAAVWSLVGGAGEPARADASDTSGTSDGTLPDTREIQAARAAAEAAIVPVLSYDYRSMGATKEAALSYLTPAYAEEYTKLVEGVIEPNAISTQTVVTTEVLSSGIVRTGVDRVDVLLFIDQPTRNTSREEVLANQVTTQMVNVAGDWLVDCLITAPGGTCETDDAP